MNHATTRLMVLLGMLFVLSCTSERDAAPGPKPCSEQWANDVETRFPTGDGQGHGPDVGSSEWRSVVEFKLGIRGEPGIPPRDSDEWCAYIDNIIRSADARLDD